MAPSTTWWRGSASTTTAGADDVCVQVLTPDLELPVQAWRDLADAFALR